LISAFGAVVCLAVSNFGAGASSANDGEAKVMAASAANKHSILIIFFSFANESEAPTHDEARGSLKGVRT
jgi:hypothetical protein